MQGYLTDGEILILRQPISIPDINKMISQKKDVVVCQKERKKIGKFFLVIWQKILKLLLGITLYDGNNANIYFGEELSPVLRETNNLSFATRIDRWKGIEKGKAEVVCDNEKYYVDKKSVLLNMSYILICILAATLVTTFVCVFTNVSVIIGLLLFCLDAICFAITVMMIITTILNFQVGSQKVPNIQEVDVLEKEEIDENLEGEQNV